MKYEWTGESRMVPNYGHPSAGDVIELPEDLGESLASQGLCKPFVASKDVSVKEE